MSIKLMTLVWDIPSLPSIPKLIYLKYADCASDDGESIFPAKSTIARSTGCGMSTVSKWTFAGEYAGLLQVVERSAGGAPGSTTTRALNVDLLRRLAAPPSTRNPETGRKHRPPPELKLVVENIQRRNDDGKLVKVPIFRVVENTDANGTPPRGGGVHSVDRSASGTGPVHPVDGRGPPGGPDSSLEHVIDPLPPTPRKRGARERDGALQEARLAKPACGRAFEKLLVPLFARVKLEAPSPAIAFADLAEAAERYPDEVLPLALQFLTEPGTHYRRYSAKPSDVEDALRSARTAVEMRGAQHRGPILWPGTPEFDAAIGLVAERNPQWAAELRTRHSVRRSELRDYGVEQVPV